MEGKDQVRDMLNATLDRVQPSNWHLVGDANEADGVYDAWFNFETDVSCGHGLIRLVGDKCWTLLTTMVELKGHEEIKRCHAADGRRTRRL